MTAHLGVPGSRAGQVPPGPAVRLRHVLLLKLRPGHSIATLTPLTEAMNALHVKGLVSLFCGAVLPAPGGAWDWALTADFDSLDSFQRYDADASHQRIRRELAAPFTEAVARAQLPIRDAWPSRGEAGDTASSARPRP